MISFYIFYSFLILSITGSVTKLDEHMVELETDERTGDNYEVATLIYKKSKLILPP